MTTHSSLENPMDRGAWWATVHEAAKSQISLSTKPSNNMRKGKRNGHFTGF